MSEMGAGESDAGCGAGITYYRVCIVYITYLIKKNGMPGFWRLSLSHCGNGHLPPCVPGSHGRGSLPASAYFPSHPYLLSSSSVIKTASPKSNTLENAYLFFLDVSIST